MHIRTVSRLHFGLIDLHGGIGRVDGGVGLALKEPRIELNAHLDGEVDVHGPLAERVREGVSAVREIIGGNPVSIEILRAFPDHVGLGSGTQAILAGGLAAARLNNVNLTTREIAMIANRGGTSGIGTATFENGGMILDGGHSFEAKGGFLPSSKSTAPPPEVLSRIEFPEWEISLLLPSGTIVQDSTEAEIFEKECPIPEREVEKISRNILMKLLPSVKEQDFKSFRDAIKRLQQTGFKRRELDLQPASRDLLDVMHDRGCAAGMSSFGPIVYAIHPQEVDTDDLDCQVWETRANNTGAEFSTSK